MKKSIIIASCALFSLGAFAQNQTVHADNIEASRAVEENIESPEVLDEVYGIMIARLDEATSESYEGGLAEIDYADMYERIANSTETLEITDAEGVDHQFFIEPSLMVLDDNFSAAPPTRVATENVVQYLNRLEELTTLDTEHHDYLVIATTGGELGMVFARVTAGAADNLTELSEGISLSVYPNPVSEFMTIKGLPKGNFSGILLDAQGRKVLETQVSENFQIDLNQLSAGFYTLQVLVNDTMITEKINVKK